MCGDKIFLLPSTSSNAIICVNQKICSQEFPSILSALYIQLEQYENENAVSKQKISFKMTFHILFFLHRSNQTCAAVCEFKVCAKSKKKERKKENFQCKNMCPSTEGIMRCKMAKWLWSICTPCGIEISVISFIQLNQPLRWLSHSFGWQQWKNGLLIVKTSLDELILLDFHFIFIFRLLKSNNKVRQDTPKSFKSEISLTAAVRGILLYQWRWLQQSFSHRYGSPSARFFGNICWGCNGASIAQQDMFMESPQLSDLMASDTQPCDIWHFCSEAVRQWGYTIAIRPAHVASAGWR